VCGLRVVLGLANYVRLAHVPAVDVLTSRCSARANVLLFAIGAEFPMSEVWKGCPQMAIESAAELVQILADELRRSGTNRQEFAEITGIAEERLKLLQSGAWEDLTIREIAIITETLEVDLSNL
jgi:DNA-binding Xre family transcriptional regulator